LDLFLLPIQKYFKKIQLCLYHLKYIISYNVLLMTRYYFYTILTSDAFLDLQIQFFFNINVCFVIFLNEEWFL